MPECKDKRFKELLAAYEMGLLDGEELQQVEQHLMVCDDCLNEVRQFHETAGHILNSPRIRKLVEAFSEVAAKSKPLTGKKSYFAVVPVAVVILIFLILQPWKIEISTKKAMAEEIKRIIEFKCLKRSTNRNNMISGKKTYIIGNLPDIGIKNIMN